MDGMLSRFTAKPLQVVAILLGISIPVSVALDNLLAALLIVLGLVGAGHQIFSIALRNPVARAAWLLFGILLLAVCYGQAGWREALGTLAKYVDLALVPLFMVALSHPATNRMAFYAFMLVMAVTLVLTCLLGFGLIDTQPWMWREALHGNPAIFRSSITQNVLMGYAVFLALLHAREEVVIWKKVAYGIFAALGGMSVLFLVIGRTGYLILFALLAWFAWSTLDGYLRVRGKAIGWRSMLAVALLMLGSVSAAYHASGRLHERVDQVVAEYKAWQPNVANAASNSTSTGERLEFYYNSLKIASAHPFIGVGTGGFPQAYAQQVAGTGILPTHNPHNEYLMLMVQAGLPALLLMLYWLYVQWREAAKLESPLRKDAARGLALTVGICCLVNSSLLDHTEGLFFAFMSALLFANLHRESSHA